MATLNDWLTQQPCDEHETALYSDEDTEDFDDQPDEEDGYITDVVRGGYDVSFAAEFVGHFDSYDDALTALKDEVRESQFYPNCWSVSDHGNHELISVESDGMYFVQD